MKYPSLDDRAGWQKLISASDARMLAHLEAEASRWGDAAMGTCEQISADGVDVFVTTPANADADDPRICLDVHGGGFIVGGGECCRAMGAFNAARVGLRTWAVDYRMPPDHPYPAALDDCITAYRALLRERPSQQIVIGGAAAGGTLAASLVLRARDEGLPLPAALLLLSPEVDLTESGDSFHTNLGVDMYLLGSLMPMILLYAGEHDLEDPYLSPLFGDFSRGFPPTVLTSGTRDLFLSNTVRMHRALRSAGVSADLHVSEATPHGYLLGTPEDQEIQQEVRLFIDAHCPWTGGTRGTGPARGR